MFDLLSTPIQASTMSFRYSSFFVISVSMIEIFTLTSLTHPLLCLSLRISSFLLLLWEEF